VRALARKRQQQRGSAKTTASRLVSTILFDLWAERWRHREAKGRVIIVRYADDLIVGFEHESDARRFWDAMRYRLEKFSLSLHPEKTRLIEFGRFAADRRARRGLGKPETFNFLGFTFICSTSRNCSFLIKRKTRRDRLRAKLCFFPRVGRARGAVGTSGCSGRVSNGAGRTGHASLLAARAKVCGGRPSPSSNHRKIMDSS
jgi:hypothetical protein